MKSRAKAIMIQGTGSHVGKSLLVAALCRIFREDGINVAPFKAQNMALNSGVTAEGHEMGRAQILQAEAAGIEPEVDMNPVLIKPFRENESQIIIQGYPRGNLSARDFQSYKKEALPFVKESYERLASRFDLIVIEGAGSPAEINLRENDLANMGAAAIADAPVILAGDIDRGGVFASLVGTLELLDREDRDRIKGFIINKFRGDIDLLRPGLDMLEERTQLPVFGVVPWMGRIHLDDEDGVSLDDNHTVKFEQNTPNNHIASSHKNVNSNTKGVSTFPVKIRVLRLPHISNHTDFIPFTLESDVELSYAERPSDLLGADIVIIPGSKSVISDLRAIKERGFLTAIEKHRQKGGKIIGICGGYQMLGESISDPDSIEGGGEIKGLQYFAMDTVLLKKKETHRVDFCINQEQWSSAEIPDVLHGYEIHSGKSTFRQKEDTISGIFRIERNNTRAAGILDGAKSRDGQVWGSYIHGIFENDGFRRHILNEAKKTRSALNTDGVEHDADFSDVFAIQTSSENQEHTDITMNYLQKKNAEIKRLADTVRNNIDMNALYDLIQMKPSVADANKLESYKQGQTL